MFFSTVLRCTAAPGASAPGASFDSLLAALLAAGTAPAAGRSAQHNIAQCIAVLCGEAGPATLAATVQGLLSQLQVCSSLSSWPPLPVSSTSSQVCLACVFIKAGLPVC